MRAQLLAVVFLLVAGFAAADDGPALPKPEVVLPPAKPAILERHISPVSIHEWNSSLKKLKAEREALATEHLQTAQQIQSGDTKNSEDSAKLRVRLTELLIRLKAQQAQPKTPPKPEPAPKEPDPPVPEEKIKPKSTPVVEKSPATKQDSAAVRPVDPLVLAHALFRAKNFEGSLRAYRLIDLHGMKAEERVPIQYLMAACLKKLGKTDEAAGMFREVANSKGDEYVALCAQWQLNTMRWQREVGDTLKDVQRRKQALGAPR